MNIEKHKALRYIDTVSFAAFDASLFLDTHPDNCEAIEYFNHYNRLRNQALAEYSKKYGPLTLSTVCSNKFWDWAETPWPWEGVSC